MILSLSAIILLNILFFIYHKNLHNINYPVDLPNKRKIHSERVLLSGGLFFVINLIFLLVLKFFYELEFIYFSNNGEENKFLIFTLIFFLLAFTSLKSLLALISS